MTARGHNPRRWSLSYFRTPPLRAVRLRLWGLTGLVFIVCLMIGFHLSLRKTLWNDELFTQFYNIESRSYADILLGSISESNNCPLYYLLQKGLSDAFHFRLPQKKWSDIIRMRDTRSQIFLRIIPNGAMSLSLASLFYFFMRFYGVWAGLYALGLSFSSFMVWAYWVEARPYAPWFFLTTLQALLFLRLIRDAGESPFEKRKTLKYLMGIHWLLCLTATLGLAQVVIVSLLLLVYSRWGQGVSFSPKTYWGLSVLPVMVTLYYYIQAPKFKFWFSSPPIQLIYTCVPLEWIQFFILYSVVFLGSLFLGKYPLRILYLNPFRKLGHQRGNGFLLLLGLNFLLAMGILLIFKIGDTRGPEGFVITNRYFIYLTAVGIIATTLFAIHLVRCFEGYRWIQLNLLIVFAGFLIIRAMKTYFNLFAQSIYWYAFY